MKSLPISFVSGLALVGMLSSSFANDSAEKCETECEGKTAKASECGSCPVAKAMEALPKMSYIIAGESSACAKSATAAADAGKEVKYVVAGEELCCPDKAATAHLKSVEGFVTSFASTHSCDASGKTYVGGQAYDCGQKASKMAAVAKAAMESVKPVYFVGEKEYCCPDKAATTAKADGSKVTYAVAGEKTCCEKTNRMNVAVAKYKAAIQAMAKVETPAEEAQGSQS